MSITLIPESAPFNDEQKAWLNGFLTGMLGMEEEEATQQNGTDFISPPAEEEDDDDQPWHDPGLEMQERMELAEGKPLKKRLMAAMAQLDCGACGYVCQTYSEAIANGEEKSLKLCSPGGKQTNRMLKKILSEEDGETASSAPKKTASSSDSQAGYNRNTPFEAKLSHVRLLNKPGSAKDVRHVEIDLSGSGLTYEVGDALGVYPTNCDELVNMILSEFEDDGETSIRWGENTISFKEALRNHCCLKEVTDELVELMAQQAEGEQQSALQALMDSDEIDQMDVLDLLQDYSGIRPTPEQFVQSLSELMPRLYSIASSRQVVGDSVHLTVGRVTSEYRDRPRKGVASTMFADRIAVGDTVRVFVQPSHGFGVPVDDTKPLIMVGPGTGIAPFRAFLQEREARQATGENWLYFGDQKSATDFLYRKELEVHVQSGLLSRLETAFSRDQAEKIYVQHRMLEQAEELFRLLEEGATFCVCGDAKRMAVDVDHALHTIVRQSGKMSPEQAREYVKALQADGRYLRDVY